jgi:PIN domain nuclease of toxin-antitoxin system
MILLDTHALVWIQDGHKRVRPLIRWAGKLYVSPITIFELQLLTEVGRLDWEHGRMSEIQSDPRWIVDDPPAVPWFQAALDLAWTRDPFDRLLAAHALYRGFRLATADDVLLTHLGAKHTLEL